MAFKKNVSEVKVSTEDTPKVDKPVTTNLPTITQNVILTSKLASKLNVTKVEASKLLLNVYSTLRETLLTEGEVTLPGLGRLQIKEVEEKSYPSTLANKNAIYVVAPHNKIVWKTTSSLSLSDSYIKDISENSQVNF